MPGDARGVFFYMPTYLNTAFLMKAFRMIHTGKTWPWKMRAS